MSDAAQTAKGHGKMPRLTLRNLGYPTNRAPGSVAPGGTEVRGLGPQPTAAAGKAAAVLGAATPDGMGKTS